MTDREFAAQQARLKRLLLRWKYYLGLGMWTVDFKYFRDDYRDGHGDSAATCVAHWQYLTATVDWNMPQVKLMSDDELEKVVIHELLHATVAEMQDDEKVDHARTEHVVSVLSVVIRWVRDNAHLVGGKKAVKA